MKIPQVPEAEASVIAEAIRKPKSIPYLAANSSLQYEDFYSPAHRLIWQWLVEAFYKDDPVDEVVIAANLGGKLKAIWACDEAAVVVHVRKLVEGPQAGRAVAEHARLVRQASDRRRLLELAERIQVQVTAEEEDPLNVASLIAADATKVATGSGTKQTTLSYDDTGRVFLEALDEARKAYEDGRRIGVWTGVKGFDAVTGGLKPGELAFFAGEPGVGKTSVAGRMAFNFAKEQQTRPKGQQVATLVLSMEMGPSSYGSRIAQMVAQSNTTEMRSGRISPRQFEHIRAKWAEHAGLPLYIDYSNNPKASQIRAIIAEAVRRYNVGFVVIDHFKTFRLDNPPRNSNDEDEAKTIFLKYEIAEEMGVVVMCLGHTRKQSAESTGKPRLGDLRGSGQIAAHADFVSFLYRPYEYASQRDKDHLVVEKTAAEIIWGKVRFGEGATTSIHFDPEVMDVR